VHYKELCKKKSCASTHCRECMPCHG
jgi:hypothetical protein